MGQQSTIMRARFIERLPLLSGRTTAGYICALVLSLVALVLRWQLDAAFPPGYPYLTFFPAVILTSFLFGPRPGLVAAFLCGLFAWYFFIDPRESFDFNQRTQVALGFYAFVVGVDIALVHLMQIANRRLTTARQIVHDLAEERGRLATRSEVLFQELQHRVGNNLQMVGAMLSLQQRGLTDPAARTALDDAARRLQVIGSIQRELYRHHGEHLPLDEFIADLSTRLAVAALHPQVRIHVEADTGRALLQGAAVPVALIVAEAIANVDSQDPASIGLRLSHVMAQQLGAALTLENAGESGAVATLTLPGEHFLVHT